MTREVGSGPVAAVRGMPTLLTQFGLLLLFAVPPSLLDLLGLGYMTPTGSFIEKIHPGTDLILLAFVWVAVRAGNPLRFLAREATRFPGVATLLGVVIVLIAYLIKVQKAPFTPVIDTFVMPPILFLMLVDMSARGRLTIERGLHVFLMGNAALGLFEFTTGWRLIPIVLDTGLGAADTDWRAAGLLGHPLVSALMAGLYATILALGAGRAMPSWMRGPAIALQFVSLAAFGGRTALVMTLLCLVGIGIVHVLAILAGRRFNRRTATILILIVPLVIGAAAALASTGFFDQMLDRFVDDNGSAKSRALIFDVFSYLSWSDILLGPDQDHLATILHLVGIEVGVESFWLGFIVLCGALMSGLVFVAFACFVVEVMRQADRLALVPLACFLMFISTTVSLSSKSAALGEFSAMVMVLIPRAPALAQARDRSISASALRLA